MNTRKFIDKLITELSYRVDEGMPLLSNPRHISTMSDILTEWGLYEIKDELIERIVSESEYETPVLNKEIEYQNSQGQTETATVGDLLRTPEGTDSREQAEKHVPDKGTPERDDIDDDIGNEGKPSDGEAERENSKSDNDVDSGENNDGDGEGGETKDPNQGSAISKDTRTLSRYEKEREAAEKEEDEKNELVNNFDKYLVEASVWDDKYGTGTNFSSITHTEDFFKDGLPEGEKVPKGFYTKVGETDNAVEVDLGGNQTVYMKSDDTKKVYKITASKNKLKSMFGRMKSGSGSGNPSADQYEWGIAVEYNKKQGMSREEAIKAADVDEKQYSKYETVLTEVCSKIVAKVPNMGSQLRQTGADTVSPAPVWPSRNGTPKTDILGNNNWRISLKKKGGSQLASGNREDASGIFKAGLEFYQTHDNKKAEKYLEDILTDIENSFMKHRTDNSVSKVRSDAEDAYVKWRVPLIRKSDRSINRTDAEKHAKAEAKLVGIGTERGNYESWLIDGVELFDEKRILNWFDSYWKSKGTEELQEEAKNIVMTAIDHKRITNDMQRAFNDTDFRKWCVYEASSGNFKFSGNSDINSSNEPIANKIMVFSESGDVKIDDITSEWAKKYSSNVKSVVAFKSSTRSKWSAWRLIQESNDQKQPTFYNDMYDIMTEETEYLNEYINESIDDFNNLLIEIDFRDLARKVKSFAKRMFNKIKDRIEKFYENIFKRAMNKIKDWANAGIEKFLEYLGIKVNGIAEVNVSF